MREYNANGEDRSREGRMYEKSVRRDKRYYAVPTDKQTDRPSREECAACRLG